MRDLSCACEALASVLAAALALGTAAPAAAQSEYWRLGTGGQSWTGEAQSQVGAAVVAGALQPVQIVPGANLTQVLKSGGQVWVNGPPEDYTVGGAPRAWSNSTVFNLQSGPLLLVDGQPATSSASVFKSSGNPAGTAFFVDLGTSYPVNRVRFYPPPDDPDAYLRAYEVTTSSGSDFDASNRPKYRRLRRVESNRDAVVDLEFETAMVRFLQVKNLSKTPFSLAEIEVYGEGFVPASSYLSKLHRFATPANFGVVTVGATRLGSGLRPGADPPRCTVRLRTGMDDTPVSYFRRDRETGEESEVTQNEYEKLLPRLAYYRVNPATGALTEVNSRAEYLALPADQQGPVRDYVQGSVRSDAANWSPWSVPVKLDSTGSVTVYLGLPGPRQYAQVWIEFAGDSENALRIDGFALEHAPLLATASVGEVALASMPVPAASLTEVAAGVETTFTCDVRATFEQAGLKGFAGVRVESFPAPVFERLEMGDPLVPVALPAVTPTAAGFDVRFAVVDGASNAPVRVVYRQAVVQHTTAVNVWLLDPAGGVPQPVTGGNARNDVGTNSLLVYTADPRPALGVEIRPAVITPNGDGVHDAASIEYRLIQFAGEVRLEVEVCDLAGRVVRRLVNGRSGSGSFAVTWDGCSSAGRRVAPGNYICRVRVDADARSFTAARVLGVAY